MKRSFSCKTYLTSGMLRKFERSCYNYVKSRFCSKNFPSSFRLA